MSRFYSARNINYLLVNLASISSKRLLRIVQVKGEDKMHVKWGPRSHQCTLQKPYPVNVLLMDTPSAKAFATGLTCILLLLIEPFYFDTMEQHFNSAVDFVETRLYFQFTLLEMVQVPTQSLF